MKFKKGYDSLIKSEDLKKFSQKFNLNEKIVEILFARGIDTEEKIQKFLFDDINNLKDPFLMTNMDKVVDRILKAIENQEKILIFGDYDTDGIGAVSILYKFLIKKNPNISTYLPNRLEDGYGLSCPCIDKIALNQKPDLIITVDCGITCHREVEYIKNLGVDIIVTDHHELPDILPNCLILNPKLEQDYDFDGLCGAGVSFKLIEALSLKTKESFEEYLPICAISTIADIVPLLDDNRIIVKEGLKRLDLLPQGIKILFKDTFNTLNNITSTDIAFKIAPKLNSTGRLDDANLSLNLYISDDMKVINRSLKQIEYFNNKRREISDSIYEECKELIKKENPNNSAIILYKEHWNVGVLGIVSAKISEEFNKPTILFGKCLGELKGSGRSIGNIDIFKLFNATSSVLNKFGGHSKAGGLSLNEDELNHFKFLANEYLKQNYTLKDYEVVKEYDLELNVKDIYMSFVEKLNVLEPYGYKNSIPLFLVRTNVCKVSRMKNFPMHLNIGINDKLNLISFNDRNLENYLNFKNKDFLLELQINEYKARKALKGIVKYCRFSQPQKLLSSKLEVSYFNQINYENINTSLKQYNSFKQLDDIIDEKTLIITYKVKNPLENIDNFASLVLLKNYNEKNLIFGLDSFDGLNLYNKIIFLEKPLSLGFILEMKKFTNAEFYIPTSEKFNLSIDYSQNREQLLETYYKLIKPIKKNLQTLDLYSYFERMVLDYGFKESYLKFYVAIKIFEEIKLIENIGENVIKFKLNRIKTDLNESTLYQKINK